MKFLCRKCKAKYQIADDKVAGRTLRMTCQQCGEPIVVRGPTRSQPIGRTITSSATLSTAGAGMGTSSASGEFAHQHAVAPAREAVHASEEWHVAINDTPVGPLRREEVARKIAQGLLDRESLVWREGMDDWLALKHVAELVALFGPQSQPQSAPFGQQSSSVYSHTGAGHALGRSHAGAPAAARADANPQVAAQVAAMTGRQAIAVDEYDPTPDSEPSQVAVASVAPVAAPAAQPLAVPAAVPAPIPAASPAPAAQMFLLVSGGAFILALGVLLGVRVLAPNNGHPAAPAPLAVAPVVSAVASKPEPKPEDSNSMIELPPTAISGTAQDAARKAAPASTATSASGPGDKKPKLTEEQRALLERMGGRLDQAPSSSSMRLPTEAPHSAPRGGQLTQAQLSAVVNGGRKNLQRCYETALRSSNSTETIRLDVDIQVSASGNVTNVRTLGKALPGMEECIARTVKMWRFPMSGEDVQTRFPVVFQPGA